MTMDLIKQIDDLAVELGGRFKLASLIQRRLQEIIRTAPHIMHQSGLSPLRMVLKEIKDGKIELEPDDDAPDVSILGS